jgi:hypothetical protein
VPGANGLPISGPGELLGTLPLSPGGVLTSQSYVITANVWVESADGDPIVVTCDLAISGEPVDTASVSGPTRTFLRLEAVHTQSVFEGMATVRCRQSLISNAVWESVRMTALEVTTVGTVPLV